MLAVAEGARQPCARLLGNGLAWLKDLAPLRVQQGSATGLEVLQLLLEQARSARPRQMIILAVVQMAK